MRRRGGFTLIELVLVVVLLAILAGVAAPRLMGNRTRQAEIELSRVQALLAIAAERDALTTEPLALSYDSQAKEISLLVRRSERSDGSTPPVWMVDPLAEPVSLDLLEIKEAASGGVRLDQRSWSVQFPQNEPRPALSLLLSMRSKDVRSDEGPSWQVDLAPDSLSSTRTPVTGRSARLTPSPSRAIDLDAAGLGGTPW